MAFFFNMNNGVIHWNRRFPASYWWMGGNYNLGHIYYKIPYRMNRGGVFIEDKLTKIVEGLFKKNPDFKNCEISIGPTTNPSMTTDRYFTAIVLIKNKEIYDKYAYII